jgi:electron transfer flavoprotein beta subunit
MGLNITVCIKSVVLEAPGGKIVRRPDTCALNPFDRPALEMALRLRDKEGGTVSAISMGPDTAALALYEALAMGVDKAVLICDPALAGSDTLATSSALGAGLKKLNPFDLVIFGARSSDSDTGQVGPQTASLLDLPLVTGVFEFEGTESKMTAKRKQDGFMDIYALTLPGVITVHPAALEPRDAPLGGIEAAFKRGAVEKMNLADLGLGSDKVGEDGSPTKVLSMNRIKHKRSCTMIDGAPAQQADALVEQLLKSGLIG